MCFTRFRTGTMSRCTTSSAPSIIRGVQRRSARSATSSQENKGASPPSTGVTEPSCVATVINEQTDQNREAHGAEDTRARVARRHGRGAANDFSLRLGEKVILLKKIGAV